MNFTVRPSTWLFDRILNVECGGWTFDVAGNADSNISARITWEHESYLVNVNNHVPGATKAVTTQRNPDTCFSNVSLLPPPWRRTARMVDSYPIFPVFAFLRLIPLRGHIIHWERLSLWDSETRHTPRWYQVRCRSYNLNPRCDVKETAYRRSTTGRTVRSNQLGENP